MASCNLSACSSRRHPASFWPLQRSSCTNRKAAEIIKNDVLVKKNDGKKDELFTCECWNSFDNIGHMWINDYWVILTQSSFVFIEQAFHTVSGILERNILVENCFWILKVNTNLLIMHVGSNFETDPILEGKVPIQLLHWRLVSKIPSDPFVVIQLWPWSRLERCLIQSLKWPQQHPKL